MALKNSEMRANIVLTVFFAFGLTFIWVFNSPKRGLQGESLHKDDSTILVSSDVNVYRAHKPKKPGILDDDFLNPPKHDLDPVLVLINKTEYAIDDFLYSDYPPSTDPEIAAFLRDNRELEEKACLMCSWWYKRLYMWRHKLLVKDRVQIFRVVQERSGMGDRITGLVTALRFSFDAEKALGIRWQYIPEVFSLPKILDTQKLSDSENPNNRYLVHLSGAKIPLREEQCHKKSYLSCDITAHQEDDCPVYTKACLKPFHCASMTKHYPNNISMLDQDTETEHEWEYASKKQMVSMIHTTGCPMRLLLSPSPTFVKRKVEYFFEGELRKDSLWRIARLFEKYRVLSVHIRMGDQVLKRNMTNHEHFERVVDDAEYCSERVEFLGDNIHKKENLPIKWFVASDDEQVRDYFLENHKEKVIMINTSPEHLMTLSRHTDKSLKKKKAMDMYSEWFLLGRGDELILNSAHMFGVSSFGRSAWLYNLKNKYTLLRENDSVFSQFERGTDRCLYKSFEYTGNLRKIPSSCRAPGETSQYPEG